MTLFNKFRINPPEHKKMLRRYRKLILNVNKNCSKELDLRLVYQACIDNWLDFSCFFLAERSYNRSMRYLYGVEREIICKSRFEVLEKLFEIVLIKPDSKVNYSVITGDDSFHIENFDIIFSEARIALEILAERIWFKKVNSYKAVEKSIKIR